MNAGFQDSSDSVTQLKKQLDNLDENMMQLSQKLQKMIFQKADVS